MRFVLTRLLTLGLAVLAAHVLGFGYALVARQVQAAQNPFGSAVNDPPPVLERYAAYLTQVAGGDWGTLPPGVTPLWDLVGQALGASLGLALLAFTLSVTLGMALGVLAVHTHPARVAGWLAPLSTLGLALPSFYIGALVLAGLLSYALADPQATSPLPLSGFGWDAHLVLPVLALSLRPTAQVAQFTATLLAGEFRQQYVMAARAMGRTWGAIRWHVAMRNILAPVGLVWAGVFRWLWAELVLVEFLFEWPGLGRLLAQTLVAPRGAASPGGIAGETLLFLNPELLAVLLAVFVGLFLLTDMLFSALARWVDPRLRGGH